MTLLISIDQLFNDLDLWLVVETGVPLAAALPAILVGLALPPIVYRTHALRQARIPRRLSKGSREALRAALDGRFPFAIPVICRFDDAEARTYAEDFVEALRTSGCDAILRMDQPLRADAKGMMIVIGKNSRAPVAEVLKRAVIMAKLDYKVIADSNDARERLAGPDGFALIVGRKRR